jgi:D-glycero-D-manno-heptose 1,7-bisphosphate phosphatase
MSSPHNFSNSKRAVFIDKDGTLIVDVPFNVDPSRIHLMPDSIDGLRSLQRMGYELIIVSNQSGVAMAYFQEKDLKIVEEKLRRLLEAEGISIHGFYYCPHHPQGRLGEYAIKCNCRKPADGMLRKAAGEHGIDLSESWMIGDILDDIEAGNRAGCRSILIDNSNETEWKWNESRIPFAMVKNIDEAASLIITTQYALLEQLS